MKRALVVHTGGIGDFLLTCPALAELAKTHQLTLAGYPDRLQLAVKARIAEQARSLDAIRFDTLFSVPADSLRQLLAELDRIILWMRDDDGHIRETLTAITPAQIDIFPGLPPQDWSEHASRYYESCLEFRNCPAFHLDIEPTNNPHDIIIHPGSGGEKKNWPLEHYQQLAQSLRDSGRDVLWSLGLAELERQLQADLAPTLHCESLTALAAHLAAANAYIGNDSGITHLAAATRTPTFALFGPTRPDIWAPQGKHVTVLRDTHADPTETSARLLQALTNPK